MTVTVTVAASSNSPRLRAVSPAAASGVEQARKNRQLNSRSPRTTRNLRFSCATSHSREILPKDSDVWSTRIYASSAERILRTLIGPAFLLIATPAFVNIAALSAKVYDSDLTSVLSAFRSDPMATIRQAFPLPQLEAVLAVAVFVVFELALFVLLPGKVFPGARAPSGFVPQFKRNGVAAFAITGTAFISLHYARIFPAEFIYDNLLQIMTFLNITAIFIALILFAKGVYLPSTADHGSTEHFLFRIYWGEELYPSVLGVDLKHFIICRVGMIAWWLFTMSFVFASIRHHGGLTPCVAASAGVNFLYVLKFSVFEVPGYLSAADIAVDRFGFMLCWGTIAFMPLVHNLQTLHLVNNSGLSFLSQSWAAATAWIILGIIMIALNYDSDTQRHRVRALDGKCLVWGSPARVLRAPYQDATGAMHCNLLLACGYHGIVRHFHYAPDIFLLFLYCAPAGFTRLLPFTYFLYLTALLLDRCQRIDRRCHAKYGEVWEQYVKLVPRKLIPGVF